MKYAHVVILLGIVVPSTWLWSAVITKRDLLLAIAMDRQQHIERCARAEAIPVRIYSPNRAPIDDPVMCQSGSLRLRHKRGLQ